MSQEKKLLPISLLDQYQSAGAGYDVLRYIGIADLLGPEKDTILYFMGKRLARMFDIRSVDDIAVFFEKMGWGKIELIKEKRRSLVFYLLSDAVAQRLHGPLEGDFKLEAGFLAESIQFVNQMECECTVAIHRKIHQVEFNVLYIN
ncbi:DUF2507 domain-containing protein [Virgibacillus soli]|uniref:DUF2507 domain-containing protein n=1 Tax=Paracerasibacillus soli TaxID=480284 RepID=UPI0035E76200